MATNMDSSSRANLRSLGMTPQGDQLGRDSWIKANPYLGPRFRGQGGQQQNPYGGGGAQGMPQQQQAFSPQQSMGPTMPSLQSQQGPFMPQQQGSGGGARVPFQPGYFDPVEGASKQESRMARVYQGNAPGLAYAQQVGMRMDNPYYGDPSLRNQMAENTELGYNRAQNAMRNYTMGGGGGESGVSGMMRAQVPYERGAAQARDTRDYNKYLEDRADSRIMGMGGQWQQGFNQNYGATWKPEPPKQSGLSSLLGTVGSLASIAAPIAGMAMGGPLGGSAGQMAGGQIKKWTQPS